LTLQQRNKPHIATEFIIRGLQATLRALSGSVGRVAADAGCRGLASTALPASRQPTVDAPLSHDTSLSDHSYISTTSDVYCLDQNNAPIRLFSAQRSSRAVCCLIGLSKEYQHIPIRSAATECSTTV
jgi:hypothetical protein